MSITRPTPEEMQRAVDERTLLPEEDPTSIYVEDALHWIMVYSELLQFKSTMIEAAERASSGLTEAARADIEVDQQLLRAQAERYRVRSEFWYERAAALSNESSKLSLDVMPRHVVEA
jgi:hypothetical protein